MKLLSILKCSVYINILFLLGGALPFKAIAQGNLLVTPARVIFEGQKKMQELNLANTGRDSARYLISMIEIRMNEDGTFDKITEPDSGQHFASDHLRFFPRNITLGPNEAQSVKVQLTKISQLIPGEYRSHIYFRSVPDEKPLGDKSIKSDDAGISVKLVPVFGITIPIIIHVGETTANVNFSDLAFAVGDDMQPRINMVFNRTGNASVYGDITVDYISTGGKISRVGTVNGIAVYTPNIKRQFHVNLIKKQGIDYSKGTLRITYTTKKENKAVQLTQAELILK
jgi:hypothetical protein